MKRSRRAAFTLIEVLVVVTIVALLASMAIPRASRSIRWSRTQSDARRFTQYSRLAGTLARTRSRTIWLQIDMDENQYWMEFQKVGADGSVQRTKVRSASIHPEKLAGSVRFLEFRDVEGKAHEQGERSIRFYADGTSDGGIAKIGEDDVGCSVGVSSVSGRSTLIRSLDHENIPADRMDLEEQ